MEIQPTMAPDVVAAAAAQLLDMRRNRRVESDLPEPLRPVTLGDAYRIQNAVVTGLLPDGERAIGYKCACTNPIAQAALQIDRPVFGRLMSHTTAVSGTTLRASDFVHRVVEAEFGIRFGADVPAVDGGHTPDTIREYVDAVVPAIEIVDHRFESWAVGALSVAADNAIHGYWIHGDPVLDWRGLDLGELTVRVRRGGELVTDGSGAAVLGHPLNVVAWLADELPRFGLGLRAGDVVTTGVATDVFEAEPGDRLVAEFDRIGSVDVVFE